MFPYPSGDGLHIGHFYNYALTDSIARLERYKGFDVFQPFGYDAFGLPAENYAKKVGRTPEDVTRENIEKFRLQMKHMDTLFEEKLVTCDKSYQTWSQWLFTSLLKSGLAYKKVGLVNHCSSCETVLANEQVKNGKCDRCGTEVTQKELNQWYFRITAYKDRLIKGLDALDWPKSTITAQRNWLENLHDWCISRQRPWGCPIPVLGETDTMDTFIDSSIYLIRYCDPENPYDLCKKENYRQVDLYVGGNEHACMHLIYVRFIHMFLFDQDFVPVEEPIKKLIHQGMILNNGEKMAKSKGNVINPLDYDSDELRLYLMFIGHYFDGGSWSDQHIAGIKKFINRFKEWMSRTGEETFDFTTHEQIIIKYADSFKFNKVVSEFMVIVNKNRTKNLNPETKEKLIELLQIFAPSIREKLENATSTESK